MRQLRTVTDDDGTELPIMGPEVRTPPRLGLDGLSTRLRGGDGQPAPRDQRLDVAALARAQVRRNRRGASEAPSGYATANADPEAVGGRVRWEEVRAGGGAQAIPAPLSGLGRRRGGGSRRQKARRDGPTGNRRPGTNRDKGGTK